MAAHLHRAASLRSHAARRNYHHLFVSAKIILRDASGFEISLVPFEFFAGPFGNQGCVLRRYRCVAPIYSASIDLFAKARSRVDNGGETISLPNDQKSAMIGVLSSVAGELLQSSRRPHDAFGL